MTGTDLHIILECIEDHAPKLREAGVLRVSVQGVQFEIAPAEYFGAQEDPGDAPIDDLSDPEMWPGGIVPGFERPKDR